MSNQQEGGGGGGGGGGGTGQGAGSCTSTGTGTGSRRADYFCHKCRRPFYLDPEDFFCPFCFGRFIEKIETVDESFLNRANHGQSTSATPNGQPAAPAGIPTANPTCSRNIRRLPSNWRPPWNYHDPNIPRTRPPPNFSNLAFLMSGNRIRGIHGTINIDANDPMLESIDWQALQMPNPGGNPIYILDSEQVHAITEETFDAMISLIWQGNPEGPPPLNTEAISNIPNASITQEQVDTNLQCAVCWEQFILEELVKKLPCSHLYHENCITPWLKMHATCPICRQNLAPPNENANATPNPQPRENNAETNGTPPSLIQTLPVLAAMLVNRFGINRPQTEQRPSPPPQGPLPSPPPAPRPNPENTDEPPPVPPRPAGSFMREPMTSIMSLIRSLASNQASQDARPPPPPQPQPPPPPSAYYDMDWEFE